MTAKKFNLKDFLINNGIIVVLVLLAIYTGIMQPTFVSGSNLKNIALNVAPRFIIACGVSGGLITKGTDLTAGRMVGLSAWLACTLLQKADYSGKFFPNMPFYGVWWVAAVLLICVAVCAIFGAINGIVVSYLQVPAFIGTLGMQLIVYGVCLVYTNATPIGGYRAAYTEVAKGQLFGFIPYLFLIALAVGIVMWFVYNKMPHGKYMYAIGGNEQATIASGINTNRTKRLIFTLSGALTGLAGVVLMARLMAGMPSVGEGYEFDAITAVIVGGTSFLGGIGTVTGALIGSIIVGLINNILNLLHVSTQYQLIVKGLLIAIAVIIDIKTKENKKSK